MLPGPMTTYRDFVVGDELALFVEVYDNTGKQAHKVDIEATLKAEGGQTVFQTREERDSSELAGGPGGYGFTARVPLKDVAPGLYVLRVLGPLARQRSGRSLARDDHPRARAAGSMTTSDVPAEVTTSGLDARLASALAYVGGWATGALFLAIERRHPGVRFHAAQAVVVFGGLSALMAVSYGAALAGAFLSGTAFRVLLALTNLTWLTGAVLWAWLLLKAVRGEVWRVPGTARLVDRLAAIR